MRVIAWFAVLAPFTVAQRTSTSARCGPAFGLTCKGSRFGDCCSQYSYCGSTDAYCGRGCQIGYGVCKNAIASSSVAPSSLPSPSRVALSPSPSRDASSSTPVATQRTSTNARCGNLYNALPKDMTCLGSKYGDCCSQYSYCGSTDAYCGDKCQPEFGKCKDVTSRSSSGVRSSATSASSSSFRMASSPTPQSLSVISLRSSATTLSSSSSRQSSSLSSSVALSSLTSDVPTKASSTATISLSSSYASSTMSSSSTNFGLVSSPSSLITKIGFTALSSSSSSSISGSLSSPVSTSTFVTTYRSTLFSTSDIGSTLARPSSTAASSATRSSNFISSSTDAVTSPSSHLSTLYSETFASSLLSSTTSLSSLLISSDISSTSSNVNAPTLAPASSTPLSSISAITDATSHRSSSLDSSEVSSVPSDTIVISFATSASSSSSSGSVLTSNTHDSSSSIATSTSASAGISDRSVTSITSDTASATASESEHSAVSSTVVMASITMSSSEISAASSSSSTAIVVVTSSQSPLDPASSTVVSTSQFTSETSSVPGLPASSSTSSDLGCKPKPSSTCNRVQNCPASTNAVATPSATYDYVPVSTATATPFANISVPLNNLTVGNEYVLTFYGSENTAQGAGGHSCCNLTAYMDDVVVSKYCVGYFWTYWFQSDGPYVGGRNTYPRSPAVVYRPSIPNPQLRFNVQCPGGNGGALITPPSMYGVSLVPRCECQEKNGFQSLTSQPLNLALNGNFADYDMQQLNPVSGWISQESWRGQVIPVQYAGTAPADDTSNNGAVTLMGPIASLYQEIPHLTPGAPYNVAISWFSADNYGNCSMTIKFDGDIVLQVPWHPYPGVSTQKAMIRNSTVVYPRATSGILWVGTVCATIFTYNQRTSYFPAMRIDDVSFSRVGCDSTGQLVSSVTSVAARAGSASGISSASQPTSV